MFGWRRRIGYITPTVMELVPYEFYSFAPEGVGLVGVTCNINDWKSTEYETGLAAVESSAKYLQSRHVDFIIHGGAPLVTNRPPGYDKELIARLEDLTGIPSTTSIRTGIESLEALNARKIVVVTPYPESTNTKVVSYLEHYGFNVLRSAYLDVGFKDLQAIPVSDIYATTYAAVANTPDAQAVYMPCPQWPVCDVLELLERDCGVPIVSSTPAAFYVAFKRLGLRDPIVGHGRLLASLSDGNAK